MSVQLVECVPNFSEGRNLAVIKEITDAIVAAGGVELLDVDPGAATNRTVVTFAGPPEAALAAAFAAIRTAARVIDMAMHKGAHPRFGATDVCPFVPVEGVTMEECADLARRLGQRVGEELGIPVYLYESAASRPERRNLASVRRGEYEGLRDKLADPRWQPDFGPAEFNARSGAVAIGAREFLIAYNITLNTADKGLANDIAFELREKGRSARGGEVGTVYARGEVLYHRKGALRCGECDFSGPDFAALDAHVRTAHGWELRPLLEQYEMDPDDLADRPVKKRGTFDYCKAIGWFVPEYGRAQISVNLTNYRQTPPHLVIEKAREEAGKRGLVVTGSEIVGLVPLQAMLMAGRFYLERQGRSTGLPPQDIVQVAIWSMGLNDVSRFEPEKRVLGMPKTQKGRLMGLVAKEFVDEVSRPSPAPGGGSVAALAGALGAGLACMVANLSSARSPEGAAAHIAVADRCQALKEALCLAVDRDTDAFNDYLVAIRMPQDSDEEKLARDAAIQAGLRVAIKVPLETARLSSEALSLCRDIARAGLKASVSDAGVGAELAHAGIAGGCQNVLTNLKQVADEGFKQEMQGEVERLVRLGQEILQEARTIVGNRIAGRKRQQDQ